MHCGLNWSYLKLLLIIVVYFIYLKQLTINCKHNKLSYHTWIITSDVIKFN